MWNKATPIPHFHNFVPCPIYIKKEEPENTKEKAVNAADGNTS
jgi:hypothetical protein